MSARPPRVRLALLALALLAPASRADESTALRLARRAQVAADAGNTTEALDLLDKAHVEWPDGDVIAHLRADVLAEQGRLAEAVQAYAKGLGGDHAFRGFFNRGVLQDRLAEQGLDGAGVPLDPAGLTDDAPAGRLLQAIDAAEPQLVEARGSFLGALAEQDDDAARESVAAINQRLADLDAMREELKKRADEEQQKDQGDQEDDQQKPGDQDQQSSDDQQQKQGGDQQGQPGDQDQQGPQDQPEEPQPGDEQQEQGDQQPPSKPGEQPQDQPEPPTDQQPLQGDVKQLTPQELSDLMETLKALEERAARLEQQRRAAQRRPVEKDW